MRINSIEDKVIFKSGYPTFNSGGHLSLKDYKNGHTSICHKPNGGILKGQHKLDYLA